MTKYESYSERWSESREFSLANSSKDVKEYHKGVSYSLKGIVRNHNETNSKERVGGTGYKNISGGGGKGKL